MSKLSDLRLDVDMWDMVRRKASDTQKRYGLTPLREALILHGQAYKCAMCETQLWNGRDVCMERGEYAVDHDHSIGTTAVRGILCRGCNTALGRVGDSLDALEDFYARAKKYLQDSPSRVNAILESAGDLESALDDDIERVNHPRWTARFSRQLSLVLGWSSTQRHFNIAAGLAGAAEIVTDKIW